MSASSNAFVGGFYIPTEYEESKGPRTYIGIGDPNTHMDETPPYFIPPPRPNDRYLQIDVDPLIEWVYTSDNVWVELSVRYDNYPPDFTEIYEIIKAEIDG